jgi:DNA-binding Lrp family transcriptional regulator
MDNTYRHIVLNFDTAKQPKFEEKKSKGWIEFGDDNNYPKYLLSLYNESPKHGAIVKSKSQYIYGKGFEVAGVANSIGETWNDILKKAVKDDELYRGYYLQIIYNRAKQVSDVFHIDFQKVRISKDCRKFYVKNDWTDFKEKPREYPAFDPSNPVGSQIFYFKEYNPWSEVYPLPAYYQGLNMIEADIQVSRHILGMANRQFTASKLIQLNNGDPIGEENKGEVERSLLKKFTGHNGQQVVIMFNKSKENAAEIVDLGTTSLTKEDFTNVNNLIQQEIFACHQITSSSLFGIATPGALGERSALRDAYEIWNNTYCAYRQDEFNTTFTKLRNIKGEQGEFTIRTVEPLKFEFTEGIMSANLTQDEIREIMGREPLQPQQTTSDGQAAQVSTPAPMGANDALRNLTGRQYQNVMRIVRNFGNGKLNKEQATLMLKSGYGLSDDEVNAFLGVDDDPITDDEINKFNDQEDDRIYEGFNTLGDDMDSYEILGSMPMGFADDSITQLEANILNILESDKRAEPVGIAAALKVSVPDVEAALKSLENRKIISTREKAVGEDNIYERKILKPQSELKGKEPKEVSEVFIRYTYEWRVKGSLDTSRVLCVRLYNLSAHRDNPAAGGRTWSMTDIQNLSLKLGYSVLDRCGGWYTEPDGTRSPQCRHEWVANIVTKKKS